MQKNIMLKTDPCLREAILKRKDDYNKKGITHDPFYTYEVLQNLKHTSNQWLYYMYEYLPRSAAECEYITNKILSHSAVANKFIKSDKTIKILSLFCGNGGDVFGVVTSIIRLFEKLQVKMPSVEISVVDGNIHALNQFRDLFDCWKEECSKSNLDVSSITIKKYQQILYNSSQIELVKKSNDELKQFFGEDRYDFITCFKFIEELILKQKSDHMSENVTQNKFCQDFESNAYIIFLLLTSSVLSERGFVTIADCTMKLNDNAFTNQLLANQAISFIKQYKEQRDVNLVYPRQCSCMLDSGELVQDCPFSKKEKDFSGYACFPQQVYALNNECADNLNSEECLFYVSLCRNGLYKDLLPELKNKDKNEENFNIVGVIKNGENIRCKCKF